jgi:DNA-binding MarR family transcriptional regulator
MTCHVSCVCMNPIEELRYLVLGAQRDGARLLADLLRPAALTAAQAEVLAVLRDAGRPLTVREIGDRLVCESGSPSRLVSSVVDAGLLERGQREGDRRAVELTLTERGVEAAQQVADAERALHDQLAQALTDSDVTAMVRGLRKLVDGRPTGDAIGRRRSASG